MADTRAKFQSKEHREKNRLAHLGKRLSEESKKKISEALIGKRKSLAHIQKLKANCKPNITSFKLGHKGFSGERSGHWKGDNVGYDGVHDWLDTYFNKKECEFCGALERLQWANKDGKYRRIREDYFVLCVKCHKKYDWNKDIKFLVSRGEDGRFKNFNSKLKAKAGGIKYG